MVRCPRLLAGIFLVVALAAPAFAASPRSLVATVQHVADGDPITALVENGTRLRLRLLGIDAPEIAHGWKPGQPYGEEAHDYLDHQIGGKTVQVDAYGPARYHRVLAVVWDEQVNVNLLMVAMDYAEVYRRARRQVDCRELNDAETKARRDRVGMRKKGANYESPAVFRKRMRLSGG